MSRLLCCLCARQADMGAALSHPQEGEACEGAGAPAAPPTMADVIRERKKKALGSGLGTLRRRIALVRRPRDNRPDRGCEHARFIRGVVSAWRLAEVFLLCEELEAAAALRDLATQAELAREPAAALHQDLLRAYADRWWCDVELVGAGWALAAHRAVLAARSTYFRDLLAREHHTQHIQLDGPASNLSRDEAEACVLALYAGGSALCGAAHKRDRDGELDVISADSNPSCVPVCVCTRGHSDAPLRRLAPALGFSLDSLHRDMRHLLDSGALSDCRLVFRGGGGGALELPCHRLVLAARSRFFRSVMARRGTTDAGGLRVCVDETVLPRRFARALLHAAYTDCVDLSLVTPANGAGTTPSGNTTWSGTRGARPAPSLDDAFQLYEIARFLEMPIVVQGCEDAIARALSPDTLPTVLRWAAHTHASQWVHRQAMRYLRDEFPTIMSSSSCGRIPLSALSEALASPFLQASETQALRGVLRWATTREAVEGGAGGGGAAVWTRGAGARRGARRREAGAGALRDALAPLAHLLRLEHLPPDHELLHQLVRRGIITTTWGSGAGSADAWLARGSYRPPRCFLPYLDEIKALLEEQAVPEAELARARRERYLHRIPDTLYMVSAGRAGPRASPPSPRALGAQLCVAPRMRTALRARARRLRSAAPAQRALALHVTDCATVYKQIALRAVREMSLPDACADLLLPELDSDRETEEGESADETDRRAEHEPCCRSGSERSSRSHPPATSTAEMSRASLHRRDVTQRGVDNTQHRRGAAGGAVGAGGSGGLPGAGARLSAAVPDVAMAPNANTHLLSARDLWRPAHTEYGGGVLQLDLGDGATHTPRPGSRAARAAAPAARPPSREHAQAMSCLRSRAEDDELRAALELSVIRAYSSLGCRSAPPAPAALPPHALRDVRSRASPPARHELLPPPHHLQLERACGGGGARAGAAVRTPRHEYRGDRYGSTRGRSPDGYA